MVHCMPLKVILFANSILVFLVCFVHSFFVIVIVSLTGSDNIISDFILPCYPCHPHLIGLMYFCIIFIIIHAIVSVAPTPCLFPKVDCMFLMSDNKTTETLICLNSVTKPILFHCFWKEKKKEKGRWEIKRRRRSK